ncbi:MAG TPA: hypothetical protein VKT28_20850 [Puia sp.]|nr:hypothetical protein [Puia sp.]
MKINKILIALFVALVPSFCLPQSSQQLQAVKDYALHNLPRYYDSTVGYINLNPKGDLNYLFPLYQLFKEENKFREFETSNGYNNEMSKAASFVEDYQSALEYHIKNYEVVDEASQKQLQKTIDDLKGVEHADAIKYISFAAKSSNVVMINESYNKPLHRAFTVSLLEELYKKGFRYLAMETLNNYSQRGFQRVTSSTGYYTNEPIGGELTRIALRLGYTLVAYQDTSTLHTSNQRDSVQADNIYQILAHDQSAKILVEASYGHIAKRSVDKNYVTMAMAFKKLSGVDPFCIDQVSMCDESEFAYGKALYDDYTGKFSISVPSVAMLDGQAINITNNDAYDVCVIHPRTTYKDNRPAWLALGGLRQGVYVKAIVKKTFLVQAYYDAETKLNGPGQLVPADQTYISTNKDNYLLFLRKGKYLVTFRDIAYHLIGKLNMEVN